MRSSEKKIVETLRYKYRRTQNRKGVFNGTCLTCIPLICEYRLLGDNLLALQCILETLGYLLDLCFLHVINIFKDLLGGIMYDCSYLSLCGHLDQTKPWLDSFSPVTP